ncbi:MAG: hypothetical protein ACFFD4_32410 [Candidatus Odinarchaeota archaeon]
MRVIIDAITSTSSNESNIGIKIIVLRLITRGSPAENLEEKKKKLPYVAEHDTWKKTSLCPRNDRVWHIIVIRIYFHAFLSFFSCR